MDKKSPTKKGLFALLDRKDPETFKYYLWFKFVLTNIVALALLAGLYAKGLMGYVFFADKTGLVMLIIFVFLYGFLVCMLRAFEISRELNLLKSIRAENENAPMNYDNSRVASYIKEIQDAVKRHGTNKQNTAGSVNRLAYAMRSKFFGRISIIRHIASALVVLGLIGTVIGFIIALSGVNPQKAFNFDSITPMISALISGMSTALYTTLVGATLNVWLGANYQILKTGTETLAASVIELGERYVK